MQKVGVEQQCPTIEVYAFSIILLASNLARGHANDRPPIPIVIFATSIRQVHRQMLVHEHTIDPIVVQAMAHG